MIGTANLRINKNSHDIPPPQPLLEHLNKFIEFQEQYLKHKSLCLDYVLIFY